jgi:hypothetical protein
MIEAITFSIEETDRKGEKKKIDFSVTQFSAIEQSFLILKIIAIVARGTNSDVDLQIEQALHNAFRTGHNVEGLKANPSLDSQFGLLLNAVKGAISVLSDKDRDELISKLLTGVKIIDSSVFQTTASLAEINKRFTGFQSVFKLLMELFKIHLGFFSPKIE